MNNNTIIKKLGASIGLILVLAIILFRSTTESIAGDEAYSIFNSLTSWDAIVELSMKDQNPPLYLFLLKIWTSIFGIDPFAVRALSAIFSTAAIAILFSLIKRLYNANIAVLACLLMVVNHSFINFGQEARCYALVLLLATISIHFMERYWKMGKRKYLIGYALSSILLIFSHYLTVFFIVTQFVAILLSKNVSKIKGFFIAWVSIGLLLTPWAIYIVNNMPEKGSFWLKSPIVDEFYHEWTKMFDSKAYFVVFLILLLVAGTLYFLKNQQIRKAFSVKTEGMNWTGFFLLLTFLPSLLEFFIAQITPIFIMRYYYYSLIGVVVLIAIIIYSLYAMNKWVGCVSVLLFGVLSFTAFSLHPRKTENWRDLVELAKQQNLTSSQIWVSPSYKTKELYYYLDNAYFSNVESFKEQDSTKNIFGILNQQDYFKKNPRTADSLLVFVEIGDEKHANNQFFIDYLKSTHNLIAYQFISGYRNGFFLFVKK